VGEASLRLQGLRLERRRRESQRPNDPALERLRQPLTRHALDDEHEHLVSGVRVGPARPGCEVQRLRVDQRDRLPHVDVEADVAGDNSPLMQLAGLFRVVRVPQATRVVEQLPHRDAPPFPEQPRQPLLDRVVQPEPALVDQLQHDRRDECLADARHAQAVTRPHRPRRLQHRLPRRCAPRAGAVSHDGDDARRASLDNIIEQTLQIGPLRHLRLRLDGILTAGSCRATGDKRRRREKRQQPVRDSVDRPATGRLRQRCTAARAQATSSTIRRISSSLYPCRCARRTSSLACATTAPRSGVPATVMPRPRRKSSKPSSRSSRSARSTVFVFTPRTAARSLAGGSRSPGVASPFAIARRISGGDLLVQLERLPAVDLDAKHGATATSFYADDCHRSAPGT
jgi:hypothetical protein